MLITKTSKNAIKMLFYLMDHDKDTFIRIRSMAEDLELPYFQTAKIAQSLIRSEILASYTGPNGGVQIKKDPRNIHLIDIVIILEGINFLNKCILGISECGSENPCPVHHVWKETKQPIVEFFQKKNLCEIKEMNFLNSHD